MPKLKTAKGPDEDLRPTTSDLDALPLGEAARQAPTPPPTPTAHHPRGMSGWPAILACPCFTSKGDSKDAEVGTATHAKLAGWLEAYKRDGVLPEVDRAALSLHEAGAYRAAQWIVASFALAKIPRERLHVEHRCTLPNGVFGTADAVWVTDDHVVHVVDFKTFYNPGRDYTPQLIGYGLAVADALLRSAWHGADEEDTFIDWDVLYGDKANAPEDGDSYDVAYAREICERAMAAYDQRDAGTATPTQCNWCELCEHHATCPAVMRSIETLKTDNERQPVAEQWGALTPVRKAQLLVVAEFAAKWSDTVRALAKADALAGVELVDLARGIAYTLRESKGRAKPRVADLWPLLAGRGVSAADYKAKLSISASDAEALLKGVGIAAKEAKALVLSVSDIGKGSVSLVRA